MIGISVFILYTLMIELGLPFVHRIMFRLYAFDDLNKNYLYKKVKIVGGFNIFFGLLCN